MFLTGRDNGAHTQLDERSVKLCEHMFSAGSSEKWQMAMKTYKKANKVSRTFQYV